MEEDASENLHDDLEVKKNEDEKMSVNTEVPSDSWLDEDGIMSSTPKEQVHEDESEKDISYSYLYGKETEETKFLVEEIDLYEDLIRIEEEEVKAKRNQEIELENHKKEIEKLRESDVQKSAMIKNLSKEKENLKRSICSFYKTAKKEIERKDELLAEANRQKTKLESILFHKNEQVARLSRYTRCQNCNHENEKDNNSGKRKRSESPKLSSNVKDRDYRVQKADTDIRSFSDKERKDNLSESVPKKRHCESNNEESSRQHRSRSPKSVNSEKERDFTVLKFHNDEKIFPDKDNKSNPDKLISRTNFDNNKDNKGSSRSDRSVLAKSLNNTKESYSSVSKLHGEEKISSEKDTTNPGRHISGTNFDNNKDKLSKSNQLLSPKSLNILEKKDNIISKADHSIKLPSDKDNSHNPANSISCPISEKRIDNLTKDNVCVLYQAPQTVNFSENSRDSTETNNIFFNMLPDSLKKSFYEYEQSQIISLNKLKQSFINEYFNSDATIPPPNLECSSSTSKSQGMHLKQLLFDKSSHAVASVSTSSLLTPSSEDHNSTTITDKFEKNEPERNFRDSKEVSVRDKPVKTREKFNTTRSNRRDLEDTLVRYRKERNPYSERGRFGHRNNRHFVRKKL